MILWTEVSSGNWEGTPSAGGSSNSIDVWEHEDRVGWYWKVLTDDASDNAPEGFSSTLDAARMHAGTAYMEWYGYSCVIGELEVSLQALKEENAMLRDEGERLRAQRVLSNEDFARSFDMGVAAGERRERAAVVAWLRDNRSASTLPKGCWEADAIERGEHRREEER